jgi:uncharacterized flavoprotein (TIGR03862 family)
LITRRHITFGNPLNDLTATASSSIQPAATTGLRVAVIGGGPAGLMAAEVLASAGVPGLQVYLYDAMPSVGRKFLLAGKGGLNLTHSEDFEPFMRRFGQTGTSLLPMLTSFGAQQLRDWAGGLGIETFVGSSGRVFPKDMKAAPLLRAWLQRLRRAGVQFCMRHRWLGWDDDGCLTFETLHGVIAIQADAVVLALGGASWSRLGSDGAWVGLMQARGVAVAPLLPANCGFDVAGWTAHFSAKFAGQPFKSVALQFTDSQGQMFSRKGEFVATATGVEGSLIYAVSNLLRDEIAKSGNATFRLDLLPGMTHEEVLAEVRHPRGSRSLSSHLKSRLKIDGIKAAMLYELLDKKTLNDPLQLAHAIKSLAVTLVSTRPIDEAISSAGGVHFEGLDAQLQLREDKSLNCPVFCAGEMLNWEAPTGGYLLTACFSSGYVAGQGVLGHFRRQQQSKPAVEITF